ASWGVSWGLCEGRNAWICGVCARVCVADASGRGPKERGSNPVFSIRQYNSLRLIAAFIIPKGSTEVPTSHRITILKVREALTYLEAQFPSPHPLADQKFETDGVELFVEQYRGGAAGRSDPALCLPLGAAVSATWDRRADRHTEAEAAGAVGR